MRHLVIVLTLVAALAGAAGIGKATLGTSAQEEADSWVGHPLVGTRMAIRMAPGAARFPEAAATPAA